MGEKKSVKIGVFDDAPNVPSRMRGATIYFSPSLVKFAITDVNGKTLNFFDYDKYLQFVSANVIVFGNGMQQYLDSFTPENEQFDDDFDDLDDFADTEEDHDDFDDVESLDDAKIPVVRHVPAVSSSPATNAVPGKKKKDPTNHLFSFFLTVFIVAAIIVIIRLFGLPIIQQLQTLIS